MLNLTAMDSVEFGKVKSKNNTLLVFSNKQQNTEGVLALKKQHGTNSSETSNIVGNGFGKPRMFVNE
jgi:hypothetical protein